MKEENSLRTRNSLSNNQGKSSLKAERAANGEHKAEGAQETRAHRNNPARPRTSKKHHGTGKPGVGQSRLELERRRAADLQARYEAGYRAGLAAGLATRRKQAASADTAPPADDAGPRPVVARAAVAVPAAAQTPHFSNATVTTPAPVAGDGEMPAAGEASAAIVHRHLPAEPATLEVASGAHAVPVTLKASMLMLHEPVPAPLRGTLASLERQNRRLDEEGLQRVEDDGDLRYRVARHLLVPLPGSTGVSVNPALPGQRRYCRPWTAEFLSDLARMHDAVFHRPLRVDSAVRTVAYQRRLISINANAAPAVGDVASPHETGAAIDIAKRGMTWREIGWMRNYLLTLQKAGLIDVEEEFYQSCFHITVYDGYGRVRHNPVRTAGTGTATDGTSDTASAAGGAEGQ